MISGSSCCCRCFDNATNDAADDGVDGVDDDDDELNDDINAVDI